MARSTSTVLIVDDRSGRSTATLINDQVTTIIRHPNDVTVADLRKAKLVLVDYVLKDWPQRDELRAPSLMPQDGIALIAVLRSNLPSTGAHPTAFALNSGNLRELSGDVPWKGREHIIAKSIDLEWVFGKGARDPSFGRSVRVLADAVAALPRNCTSEKRELYSILKLPARAQWRTSAIEEIDKAQPPDEIRTMNTGGVAILRWLLHSVLQYPTLLIDSRYLAARMKVSPASLFEILRSKNGKAVLEPYQYKGVLANFGGPRWWRAGIEQWIYEKTFQKPFETKALHTLARKSFPRVAVSDLADPVVTLGKDFLPTDELIELSTAIEIRPEGWPLFADAAWVSREQAAKEPFRSAVPQAQQFRLKSS